MDICESIGERIEKLDLNNVENRQLYEQCIRVLSVIDEELKRRVPEEVLNNEREREFKNFVMKPLVPLFMLRALDWLENNSPENFD